MQKGSQSYPFDVNQEIGRCETAPDRPDYLRN